ncbi:transposase [Pseudoalteromonas luteoviolacea]|uniref:transposase n=1 Tax=Pseudoalteromonas luteoviolacea TaxID=43657 RepID=UPI0012DACF76|nr:transposase [Pseudoalteromonas luteoviolacea]
MLKLLLPSYCRPVIVMDTGFKVPWLKAVKSNSWYYISRVRGTTHLKREHSDGFISCQSRFKNNRRNSHYLGASELAKRYQYHDIIQLLQNKSSL